MLQVGFQERRRRSAGRGFRIGLLALGALSLGAPASAIVPEPLVIRVQDAIGAPGERTAIVLRTYASRPVRRGRILAGIAPIALAPGAEALVSPLVTPILSYDEGYVFSVSDDVSATIDFTPGSQSIDANFESLSATINAQDGVIAVFYVTLDPNVVPGSEYTITVDSGLSFLDDAGDNPVAIQPRAGTLKVRAPTTPVAFSADGGKVEPGSGAVIEIGTEEPYNLQGGRIVLDYDPAIATELPQVIVSPRHGQVTLDSVTYPQAGRVQIDFSSAAEDWNSLPGALLFLHFGTPPGVTLGTISPIALLAGPGQSSLLAPGSVPLQVLWEQKPVEFELDPGIFNDGFDTGDRGLWAYLP